MIIIFFIDTPTTTGKICGAIRILWSYEKVCRTYACEVPGQLEFHVCQYLEVLLTSFGGRQPLLCFTIPAFVGSPG